MYSTLTKHVQNLHSTCIKHVILLTYICICISIFVFVYTYIYTEIKIHFKYVYIYIYIYTYIHTYIHACMHACMHTYIHTYIHTLSDKHTFGIQDTCEPCTIQNIKNFYVLLMTMHICN